MKKYNKILILMFTVLLLLTGCSKSNNAGTSSEAASEDKKQSIKLIAAHVNTEDSSYHKGMLKFKEVLEKESGGQMTVEIHPNGTLGGNEDELVQKMATGTVDIIVASPNFLAQTVKQADIFSLPYLFKDTAHWEKVVDGDPGRYIANTIENATDFKVLGYWACGIREYFGIKPITKIEDLRNVKIRVHSSPIVQEVWATLGAQPTTLAYNELYQGLQNHVIDAAENDLTNIYLQKFYEVGKYISLTDHDIATRFFLMSAQKYDNFTEEQKEWINTAAKEASLEERNIDRKLAGESLEKLKQAGAIVNEVDKAPFIEKTEPIRQKAAKNLGLETLLEKINSLK